MEDVTALVETTLRSERVRITGALLRACGDLAAAEDALHEALLAALRVWPSSPPDRPAAWLTTAARRVLVDRRRHEAVAEREAVALAAQTADAAAGAPDVDDFADDTLRLLFTSCHPALPFDGQIALTLKVVVGFSTAEIARAFATREDTVSQRILRAKTQLRELAVPFAVPEAGALAERLDAVLGVVYAIFNEGHTARAGATLRPELLGEALRLGRLLCELAPEQPAAFGLLALMAFGAARAASRVDGEGLPVSLAQQARDRWDRALIREGLIALDYARSEGGGDRYVLEAEIAASHVTAPSWEATDWHAVVRGYDALLACTQSAIVALNRAVAVAMRDGPRVGLALLPGLRPALAAYPLFYAVRADLLARLGRDGRADLKKALALTTNEGERALLARRLREAMAARR